MAKFVLLHFKDDRAADRFVHNWDPTRPIADDQLRVVGVYKDATHKTCECTGVSDSSRLYRFHRKYGWYVHGECGRVSKRHRVSYGKRLFTVFGMNMLPRKITPKSLQNPETFDYEEE